MNTFQWVRYLLFFLEHFVFYPCFNFFSIHFFLLLQFLKFILLSFLKILVFILFFEIFRIFTEKCFSLSFFALFFKIIIVHLKFFYSWFYLNIFHSIPLIHLKFLKINNFFEGKFLKFWLFALQVKNAIFTFFFILGGFPLIPWIHHCSTLSFSRRKNSLIFLQ